MNATIPVALRIQLAAVLSGFAGLGYEMVWVKMLTVSLGHEIVSVLAVLAAFFVGLAFGAWMLSDRIIRSETPQRWYAGIEAVIGFWAVALIWLMPLTGRVLPGLIGAEPSALTHAGIAFGATLFLLAPATVAMGATLPAAERVFSGAMGEGHHVGRLYGLNTLGAVLGTVLGAFVLAPRLGFQNTLGVLAVANLLAAVALSSIRMPLASVPVTTVNASVVDRHWQSRLGACLFISGLLGLGYEVVVVRVMSQVLENTVFTFAAVLSVYLAGTALGAAIYQRHVAGRGHQVRAWLVALNGIGALLGLVALSRAPSIYGFGIEALGQSMAGAIFGDLLLATIVFFPPTLAMGALFSDLAQEARGVMGLGRAVACNTLGSGVAPPLFGMVLLPMLGARDLLLGMMVGYLFVLILAPRAATGPSPTASGYRVTAADTRGGQRRAAGAVGLSVATLAGLAGLLMAPLQFVSMPPGGSLVDYREGVMASVAVVKDAGGVLHLKVNNQYTMGSTSANYADHRQTHIPILMHPAPESALFLGVGTGASMNAAQFHPGLAVTAVELVPEVLGALHYFNTDPAQNAWRTPPRLLTADARRYVLSSPEHFDVIVADLFHPSRDGAGFLYTQEHFAAVRERLSEDGLFCQWLPLFQMDLDTLRLITRSFLEVFPDGQMVLPHFSLSHPIVGLVGGQAPLSFGPGWLGRRVADETLQRELIRLKLNSDFAVLGGYLGGSAALEAWTRGVRRNTDDHPHVNFVAPRFEYEKRVGHGERLLALNADLTPFRDNPFRVAGSSAATDGPEEDAYAAAFDRYLKARDMYLTLGSTVRPDPDIESMLAQTKAPLLAIISESPDFEPAYGPLLNMAQSLSMQNIEAAVALLREIDAAAPSRPEARYWLDQLRADAGTP